MEMDPTFKRAYENNRQIIEKDMQERYSKFGFDISKATRSLANLTSKEAITIGEIFHKELSPWIIQRGITDEHYPFREDNQGINLLSRSYIINMVEIGGSTHQDWIKKHILLFSEGEIYGAIFANEESHEAVSKYLCSLGIRTFGFPEERFRKSQISK
jgi:hypothetical protein